MCNDEDMEKCEACNKGVVKVLKNLKLMQMHQDKMDEDLGRLKGEMAETKGEMTKDYGDGDWYQCWKPL